MRTAMKINIATNNPSKIVAVKEAFLLYEEFKDACFITMYSDSCVSEQPKSIEEVIEGAMNRKEYHKHSVIMALTQVINKKLYM